MKNLINLFRQNEKRVALGTWSYRSRTSRIDQISDKEFKYPNKDVPACRDCPNESSCETKGVCNNWSLADFAAHLLTHEEKNVDIEVNETLQHMAEHDETHLHQIQSIISGLHNTEKKN